MCKNLWMYPVVKYKDDSQELLMQYGVCVENREEFNHLMTFRHEFKLSRLFGSKFQSIQKITQRKNFKELVKFVNIPCGVCADCLKERSRQWAIRILKEAEQYKNNAFITFTYDDEHLPADRNLISDEISKFNKKLKTYLKREGYNSDFRFYGVGEYGSTTARPHYHVIYFNFPVLRDLEYYKASENGDLLFNSEWLNSVWSKGFCVIGSVDVGSASYVARYCDKKRMLSKSQKEELIKKGIVPEFSVMSRRPGIGANYLERVLENVNNGIYTIAYKDNNFSLPKYYSDKVKELVGEDVLFKYQENKMLSQYIKINNDLVLSDRVGSVQQYNDVVNKEKLDCKKKRLDL